MGERLFHLNSSIVFSAADFLPCWSVCGPGLLSTRTSEGCGVPSFVIGVCIGMYDAVGVEAHSSRTVPEHIMVSADIQPLQKFSAGHTP